MDVQRTFVIAEAGVNHNGDMKIAHELVEIAADAGADAIKFQTFDIDAIVSRDTPMAQYQKENTQGEGGMHDMLQGLALSREQFAELAAHCRDRDLSFMSTAFDPASVEFLTELSMPYMKSPSGEINNPDLLKAYAESGLPVLLSTGMANLADIERALDWLEEGGCRDVTILHCVSNYPAAPAEANLAAMDTIAAAFGRPVGWSDHTLGDVVALAAVARGAVVIEKHFTLDSNMPGPDHKASLEPAALTKMIEGIRIVELAIGSARKAPTASERETMKVARRSLAANYDISEGQILTGEMVALLRPGTGIPAHLRHMAEGRRASRDLSAGDILDWSDLC